MNRIAVFSSRKKLKKYERQILALAQRVFFFLRKGNVAVEFFLLDESQMRRINRRFGKKDKVTNVLSFVEPKDFIYPPELFSKKVGRVNPASRFKRAGEIYLCPDFIVKKKQSFELMVVHGILHLLGYGHRNRKERARMERKEEKILKFLTEKRFS
ncbi:rRNA maturation RNase YbeY [Candidatus Wolfebacteria bacterium GWA1_42_9]|nr:MAG: rRNA maturation RNase YbeY [Candidatus Wolfebacteria bacterium GWA1_42_9]